MVAEYYVVVLYNTFGEKVLESLAGSEYPSKDEIEFGLTYKGVAYANVEKRYRIVIAELK